MADPVVLVLDGSPEAAAAAEYLRSRARLIEVVEAHGAEAAIDEALRRLGARKRTRVALLADAVVRGSVDGREALAGVRRLLKSRSAFDRRVTGADIIASAQGSARAEVGALAAFEQRIAGRVVPNAAPPGTRRPRGRPPGTDPFRGVGLELAPLLVLQPGKRWTERELATLIGRAPSSVGRMTLELSRRGYLSSGRRGTTLLKTTAYLDAWREQWRTQAPRRRASTWRWRAEAPSETVKGELLRRAGAVLAGPSALPAGIDPIDGPLTAYVHAPAAAPEGLVASTVGRPDVVLWEASDDGVFVLPRASSPIPSTNLLVTYLDLAVSGVPRWEEAAARLRRDLDDDAR